MKLDEVGCQTLELEDEKKSDRVGDAPLESVRERLDDAPPLTTRFDERDPPQLAGTFSSHLVCTHRPHVLHVFPCLLKPQIED